MKKMFIAVSCLSLLAFAGCGDKEMTPEDFTKAIVEKQFEGLNLNLKNLDYDTEQAGEDMAMVTVKGKIPYKKVVQLVKQDDKWILAAEANLPTARNTPKADVHAPVHAAPATSATHLPPKKQVSHQ
ncbi:MAG: hypothetical protein CSA22_02255 [Deltaproteobacteria bacterium]|nr:MAG: hypothetical protein CSA22_02255 [Deltaproteobacteria bacterium]